MKISIVFAVFGCLQVASAAASLPNIDFAANPCPQVLGCQCENLRLTHVSCHSIGLTTLSELATYYPNATKLTFDNWEIEDTNLDVFSSFKSLTTLQIINGNVEKLSISKKLPRLATLNLDKNDIEDYEQFCDLFEFLPSLRNLSVSNNYLNAFGNCSDNVWKVAKLKTLKLRSNSISSIYSLPSSLENLDIASNQLNDIVNISTNLVHLDLSHNEISTWKRVSYPRLKTLDVSSLRISRNFSIDAPLLTTLKLDDSKLRFINFNVVNTPKLERFSGLNLEELVVVSGQMPPLVTIFQLTDTKLATMPQNFFEKSSSLKNLTVSSSAFECDKCVLQWTLPVSQHFKELVKFCKFDVKTFNPANCTLGISSGLDIQQAKHGDEVFLRCLGYGSPMPKLSWWLYRPSEYLGSYDPVNDGTERSNVTEKMKENYDIVSGGSLFIRVANRSVVERYVCVVENEHEKKFEIIKFRLDYTDWYSLNVFKSVFWGGLASAFIVCALSFLLNITWILTRKSILWWIQRAERLSRVRKMVEAMEKYRSRQMHSLHEKYTQKVQLVRDNYHQQVEALRLSYSSQSEKFRDYRTAQMGAVSSHLEHIRDNYNQQLNRVREYGSKRAESLWESYDRQVNRMRAFSLQQRLKMMRQYKVKQRYLNKLLESFQDTTSPEEMFKKEEEVRAALELPDPLHLVSNDEMTSRLSRSSSFHSLPEYVIDDDGTVRPSPITASRNGAVRFSPHHQTPLMRSRPSDVVLRPRSESTNGESTGDTGIASMESPLSFSETVDPVKP